MFRDSFKSNKAYSPEGFKYRGLASTRLEALTDTVFGFSITLLVISESVPSTYLDLQVSMYGFLGFIFCTLILLAIWNGHARYFTKYGLEDSFNQSLNFIFLFILLFYVYPLKYLFNIIGTMVWLKIVDFLNLESEAFFVKTEEMKSALLTTNEWADLMVRFGIGFFFIYLIFFLWHVHAYNLRDQLHLNRKEIILTKKTIRRYATILCVPILSMLIVLIFGGAASGFAGAVYAGIFIIGYFDKRSRRKLITPESKLQNEVSHHENNNHVCDQSQPILSEN